MKSMFYKISMAIVFFVILFANASIVNGVYSVSQGNHFFQVISGDCEKIEPTRKRVSEETFYKFEFTVDSGDVWKIAAYDNMAFTNSEMKVDFMIGEEGYNAGIINLYTDSDGEIKLVDYYTGTYTDEDGNEIYLDGYGADGNFNWYYYELVPGKTYLFYFSKTQLDSTKEMTSENGGTQGAGWFANSIWIGREGWAMYSPGVGEVEADTEWYEKVMAFFVVKIGELFRGLISVIIGQDITIDDIVFDRYGPTVLAFFTNDIDAMGGGNSLIDDSARKVFNFVFYVFRNIALVSYMAILVYMGIRILLVSTADKKAKAKELLLDWIKGIAILFLFPYVIRYTILLNHGLATFIGNNVNIQGSAKIESSAEGLNGSADVEIPDDTGNYMYDMYKRAKDELVLAYAICWFIMLIQIIQFLVVYFKRLITVMFLIAIFPLVTISYAIDKIGDGKSQAFNNWCKEFVLQVFIQSFHAINYVLVMGIVSHPSLDNWFLRIIGITYVAKGGDIIKSLFAQMKGSVSSSSLDVAKSLMKTKVAMSAVKGFKNFASKTIGSQSLIGKGIGLVGNARSSIIESAALKRDAKARQTVRNRGEAESPVRFNPIDGSRMSDAPLTDEQIKENANKLLNSEKHSDKELAVSADKLSSIDDLDAVLRSNGFSEVDINSIKKTAIQVTAISIIKNPSRYSNIEIQTAVEIVLNDVSKNGRSSYLAKYLESQGFKDKRLDRELGAWENNLHRLSASHSITIDEEARRARPDMPTPTDDADKVRLAMRAIKNASSGEYSIEELLEYSTIVENVEKTDDDDLKRIISEESNDMNYTLDEFRTNLSVQVINNYKQLEGDEDVVQSRIDNAIRNINNAREGDKKYILDKLNTDVKNLKEGYLPQVISQEARRKSDIQEEIKKQLSDDPYSIDLGEEYDRYLLNKSKDLRDTAAREALTGATMIAVGVPATQFRLATGIVTAGVATGMSTQGKADVVSELATVIPGSFAVTNNVADKIEKLGTTVIKPIGDKVLPKGSGAASRDVDKKSIDINKKYYQDMAELREVNRQISNAEQERDKILERLRKLDDKKKP